MEAGKETKPLRTEGEVQKDYNIAMASFGDSVRNAIDQAIKSYAFTQKLTQEMNEIKAAKPATQSVDEGLTPTADQGQSYAAV